jgi:hypothetical protein
MRSPLSSWRSVTSLPPIDSNDADDTVDVHVRKGPRADPDGRAGLALLEGLDCAIRLEKSELLGRVGTHEFVLAVAAAVTDAADRLAPLGGVATTTGLPDGATR